MAKSNIPEEQRLRLKLLFSQGISTSRVAQIHFDIPLELIKSVKSEWFVEEKIRQAEQERNDQRQINSRKQQRKHEQYLRSLGIDSEDILKNQASVVNQSAEAPAIESNDSGNGSIGA